MKRILFNKQFLNAAGDDLAPGKIHTIRRNYDYWKNYEGQDVALAYWTGKPYRSKQKVFCVKRLVSVQKIKMEWCSTPYSVGLRHRFLQNEQRIDASELAANDGFFCEDNLQSWFFDYPAGELAILHFTDFKYMNGV
jgi:hypothetical protein